MIPHDLPLMSLDDAPAFWSSETEARASAVLALFIKDKDQELSLLFTRRASEMRSHAGQVGFPGGRREVYDESPAATALREAWEEIGLPIESVTILGMSRVLKSLDSKTVLTIVGYTETTLEELKPSPDEVAGIFLVPWRELTADHRSIVRFNIFGRWRETPFYDAKGEHIWGLTAWMLDSLAMK